MPPETNKKYIKYILFIILIVFLTIGLIFLFIKTDKKLSEEKINQTHKTPEELQTLLSASESYTSSPVMPERLQKILSSSNATANFYSTSAPSTKPLQPHLKNILELMNKTQ